MTGPTSDPQLLDVHQLLERQAQLQGWLDSLASETGQVPDRVIARVRADYEGRLRDVLEKLGAHQDSIRADVDRLRALRQTEEGRFEEAVDRLEEARLRHRIGELDDATWGVHRADLERSVEEADRARGAASAELERLERLLDTFHGSEDAGGPSAEPTAPAWNAPEAAPPISPAPEPAPSAPEAPAEPTAAWTPEPGPPEDLEFLAGLDRALEASGRDGETSGEPSLEETRPKVGIRCPECGYTNDSTAWYCGVCGVDLA